MVKEMRKILIVDDEKEYLKVFGMIFHNDGYRVLTASSGEKAIEKYKSYNPELVIIDHHMPGLNGLETIERIKKVNYKCTFIMISGLLDINLINRAKQLGVRHCYSKPVKLYEIKKIVSEELGMKLAKEGRKEGSSELVVIKIIINPSCLQASFSRDLGFSFYEGGEPCLRN